MALDADKRTAGGYSHHPECNGVEWQRDLDMSGFVEDILGVEGYVSGDFSQKLNALNGGLGMPLFFRPGDGPKRRANPSAGALHCAGRRAQETGRA